MRKYEIVFANTVLSMVVGYKKTNDGLSSQETVYVGVDLANDKVYFDNKVDGIDYDDLEQEILINLKPPFLEKPEIPKDMLIKMDQYRSGIYQET
jgi:hypothetical protein